MSGLSPLAQKVFEDVDKNEYIENLESQIANYENEVVTLTKVYEKHLLEMFELMKAYGLACKALSHKIECECCITDGNCHLPKKSSFFECRLSLQTYFTKKAKEGL